MIVNLRMSDGRTTFQFASRKDMRRALGHEPPDEDARPVHCWAKWNPEDPGWSHIRVHHIRKHSVAFVVDARDMAESEAELPAKAVADERAAKWAEREQAA